MPTGRPTVAASASLDAARVEPSVRNATFDLAKTYTNEFARRAKDKFKA